MFELNILVTEERFSELNYLLLRRDSVFELLRRRDSEFEPFLPLPTPVYT